MKQKSDKMSDDHGMAVKLIPEYSGEGSVTEWLEKAELVCELRKVTDVATVLPLRLTGNAFAVYQQMPKEKKGKLAEVKKCLIAAFTVNAFTAYEKFAARRLEVGESPDVFLANLRTLAEQFGGVSEKTLTCAFMTGLPEGVKQVLRAGANIEDMKLETILRRARALLTDEGVGLACGLVPRPSEERKTERVEVAGASVGRPEAPGKEEVRGTPRSCFKCGGPNHFARHCWMTTRERRGIKCFKCDEVGHVAAKCPARKPGPTAGNA